MLSRMDLKNLVLRPNCLLTPSQLVFLPGPRSLLFYTEPFGQLPGFLYEHGYRVQLINLPFRLKNARVRALTLWLQKNKGEKFHFVLAESTYAEFKSLIPAEAVASLTILTNLQAPSTAGVQNFLIKDSSSALISTPITYRVHEIICLSSMVQATPYSQTFSNANRTLLDRFLDHCIKLAEDELYA